MRLGWPKSASSPCKRHDPQVPRGHGDLPLTVKGLRDQGHDALHLYEEGLERLPDEEILEKAHREGRILLTHDLDFSQLLAQTGAEGPSVILFRLADMRPESVNRHLELVLAQAAEELNRGAIISVREGQIRVHPLPIRGEKETETEEGDG